LRSELFRTLENKKGDSKKVFANIPIRMNMRPEDLEDEFNENIDDVMASQNSGLPSIMEDDEESDMTTKYMDDNMSRNSEITEKMKEKEDTSYIKVERWQEELNTYSIDDFINDMIKLIYKQGSFEREQNSGWEYDISLFDEKLERKVTFIEQIILLSNGLWLPSFARMFTVKDKCQYLMKPIKHNSNKQYDSFLAFISLLVDDIETFSRHCSGLFEVSYWYILQSKSFIGV
jgi:hypothetical protein